MSLLFMFVAVFYFMVVVGWSLPVAILTCVLAVAAYPIGFQILEETLIEK